MKQEQILKHNEFFWLCLGGSVRIFHPFYFFVSSKYSLSFYWLKRGFDLIKNWFFC